MFKRVKQTLQSSKSPRPPSKGPNTPVPGIDQLKFGLDRLAEICNSVSIAIPGVNEATRVAMQVVKVAQVRHTRRL